jgi:hypothetical protein
MAAEAARPVTARGRKADWPNDAKSGGFLRLRANLPRRMGGKNSFTAHWTMVRIEQCIHDLGSSLPDVLSRPLPSLHNVNTGEPLEAQRQTSHF